MTTVRVPFATRSVRYGLVAAVAAVILVGSILEPDPAAAPTMGPLGIVGADKWTHAFAYAGLAATLLYASVSSDRGSSRVALAVVLTVGFGIGVELVQWPIPYRTASTADALADAVGAGVLALAWWSLGRFVRFVPVGRWRNPTQ
ncbi:VanZ family protein [Halococcus saccharolyticus]|uniref:VanZ family protein n=1 Tax=Halococcus saccharolyticus DSM 5350 TaxID=1227455 RepID=M0MPR9_9EURY|nr:VanZ family protein [Halococcus saccharolyticus]EMA46729.1 VanZ family protein [Halococcus saccharolyticus DSM 5350]